MEFKKYTLEIAPDAERDLDSIENYMISHFLSEQAAKSVMGNIKTSLSDLMSYPEIGIKISDRLAGSVIPKEYLNLRMVISGSYLIFYVIEQTIVQIYRVVYQKRDWVNMFRK